MEKYNSEKDTWTHIRDVASNLMKFRFKLFERLHLHDKSKLESPEKELFDKYAPLLKSLTYGSEEYKESLVNLKPALDHHYTNNSHHPEHYENGIDGMCLIDVVEMLCDWLAAVKRTDNGDIYKSLEINRTRFNMSDQLYSILKNTVDRHFKEK